MIDRSHLPADWRSTLARLQETWPGAMIAGGALRDLEHGRPVKDVDIFAPNVSSYAAAKAAVAALGHCTSSLANKGPEASYTGWATDDVVGIFSIPSEFWDYQLICLTGGPDTVLDRIDFGLCRIAYDGDMMVRTDAYNRDKHDQAFTLIRCEDTSQFDRSVRRWERLSAKYTGWPLRLGPSHIMPCGCNAFESSRCGS